MTRRARTKFRSAPAVGLGLAALLDAGFSRVTFLRKGTDSRGPVLLFSGERDGKMYELCVGRVAADRLDWAARRVPTKRNPAVLSMPSSAQLGGIAKANRAKKLWLVASSGHKRALNWIVEAKSAHSARWKVGETVRKKAFHAAEITQEQAEQLLVSGKAKLLSDAQPATAPSAQLGPARKNPPTQVYDPREEQLRAQRQGIYESEVKRQLGLPSSTPFRDARTGRRLDCKLKNPPTSLMFAIGTAVQQRDSRLRPGSQTATPRSAWESEARYENLSALVLNRQDYEETLALSRKSGFYRAVAEPTQHGLRFFVWPMPPGQERPLMAPSAEGAERMIERLNRTLDPRKTSRWWTPRRTPFTRKELSYWLPPSAVFSPSFEFPQPELPLARRGRA